MSIIADTKIQSSRLVLAETLDSLSGIKVDLVQEAGLDSEQPYLFFWASGGDIEAFKRKMYEDDTVTDIECYTKIDGGALYRARITAATEIVVYPILVKIGAEMIDFGYADGWWHGKMRLPDRDQLTTLEQWCDERDVDFELKSLYSNGQDVDSQSNLTEGQHEVLTVALEVGYFDIPRKGNLSDIGDELNVSRQAVSERLRRGHRQLVDQQL